MRWRFLAKLGQFWNETVGKLVPWAKVHVWAGESATQSPTDDLASDLAKEIGRAHV